MTIQVDNALPPNVVEIGNEITQGVVDGLMSASPSASSSNPYATVNGISGVYLPLAGGTMTGDIGVNYNDLNQVTSIVFADSTVQTTASTVGTGVLLSSNNLSDLSNISTARTNLGLGSVATLNTSAVLQTANNLSEVTPATARTNLGLAYATNAQSNAGTSASTVLTPSNALWTAMSPAYHNGFAGNVNNSSAALGGGVSSGDTWGVRAYTGTSAGGYGIVRCGASTSYPTSKGISVGNIDWSKIVIFSGTCYISQQVANCTIRAGFGATNTLLNTDLTSKGIGYRCIGTGALELCVHNGTSHFSVASSFTPTSITFDFLIYSDGIGNATLYVNDNQVATLSNAPVGGGSNNMNFMFCEADTSATLTTQTFHGLGNPKIYLGR